MDMDRNSPLKIKILIPTCQTTIRYHFAPTRRAKLKTGQNTTWDVLMLLVGQQNRSNHFGKPVWKFLMELNIHLAQTAHSGTQKK